ncbi:MAG TPA: MarR family transcriptional regulator [Rhodobacteraceae bacterium]|nr:MarR family transcriptional regulator [Paracoccaceae bacterium]
MGLTPATREFILHWGEMGTKWGVNRSVAQIHALLHIMPKPMTAEEICDVLGLARSNVSTALKELQGWKLVKATRELGDRRVHFSSVQDVFDMVSLIVEGRREREYLPTIDALRRVTKEAEDDGTPKETRARMTETLEIMEQLDNWYQDINRLPRSVQLTIMKLGAKIARFLPKSG